jgi:hypothetical protein
MIKIERTKYNIFKKSREHNRECVRVYLEKLVSKIENYTFWF